MRHKDVAGGVVVRLGDAMLYVRFVEAGIVRVQKFAGSTPPPSALIRYGFYRDDWPPVSVKRLRSRQAITIQSNLMGVTINTNEGRLAVHDAKKRELLQEQKVAHAGPAGHCVRFRLPARRRFFGLGDQTRTRIEHRGAKGDLWVRNVTSYIPIPLILSSDGFGILFNTTRRVAYDLGATSRSWFGFEVAGPALDYYVLYGPTLKDILRRYTDVTGKPPLPPKWALGLWFICRTQADAREFMDDCYTFRREGIPCDAISLEPGWMAKNYDFSVTKDWHPERFPVPSYARTGRHNFFPTAKRMGFKPGLWLCCDYDLSYEEERRLKEATVSKEERSAFAKGHEVDVHLAGARRMDPWTRPDEPWFKHLKRFVDEGAEWFKQDGANQVLDHPDRLWGNGMTDEEMHNLYPLLYSKQMYLGFREHTGRRPFCFTPAGWAGLQRYTGTWTGDTGGEVGPLGACLNLSLSGHGMTTCDMEVTTKEGIHFGFWLPWTQLNSWNYWRHPWLQGDELKRIFTEYDRLRYRLIPYLYSCAWDAHKTGIPMMRALPLEFPTDPKTYALLRQYMLGPAFMVGAFTKRIYLPKGEWFDFWTEQKVCGPKDFEPPVPADRGGPLFVRAGAIVPMGRDMDYVGQRPEDTLTLHVYAGSEGSFVLYEDDGTTFEFEHGAFRTTRICHKRMKGEYRIEMDAAQGDFPGALSKRMLQFVVHGVARPSGVAVDGETIFSGGEGVAPSWEWNAETSILTIRMGERVACAKTVLNIR